MNNEDKCNKYEAFFVFNDEKAFLEHIENCPDCKAEYEKYLKVSELVKEVGVEYLKRQERNKKKTLIFKQVACFLVLIAGLSGFMGYRIYDDNSFQIGSADESYIYAMGLPTDEYGFLEL